MKQCEWERFHKLLNDNSLWPKLSQDNHYSLLCAVSTALYFTDAHRDAVKKQIVTYFISQTTLDKTPLMIDMTESLRELFIRHPEHPRFEDLILQIVAELFQTRIELFYVSPRGLSTKLFFKKTSKKIRIARHSSAFYMAVFRQPFREKASIAKCLIHEIINIVLDEEKSEVCDRMYPVEQINQLNKSDTFLCHSLEFEDDLHEISRSHLNATLKSINSKESSAQQNFSFKWSRTTDLQAEENVLCTKKSKIFDSLFDLNPKGPLSQSPLVRDGKERSVTLATGLPVDKDNSKDSQLSQSDVFEVIESTTREILPPKQNVELSGLSIMVTQGFENMTKEVEENQLSSIFGLVDNSNTSTGESVTTQNTNSQPPAKKPFRSKLKATVKSFVPDKFLENIFVSLPGSEHCSQSKPQLAISSSSSRNEMFMQNLSIIQNKPLSKPHPLKEAFSSINRVNFQKPAKDISSVLRHTQVYCEGSPQSEKDTFLNFPAKVNSSSQVIAPESGEILNDSAKNERDEVLEEEPRTGILKFFDEKNGYGFITVKDVSNQFDIFVYRKDLLKAKIKMDTIRQVKKGIVLTFSFQICHYVGRHNASRKAKNIKLCTEKVTP